MASDTRMSNTSAIFLPLNLTRKVSLLYLVPWHTSHGTYISGKKCISIFLTPSPQQASHLPPLTLNENLPLSYPFIFDSFISANKSLISSKTPTYVAGLLLGVLPIGSWLISTTLSTYSKPLMPLFLPGTTIVP